MEESNSVWEVKLQAKIGVVAERVARIAPFYVMALLARAQELEACGYDIIHLEVGEPDFSCPQAILEAGKLALDNGKTRYTPAQGIAELREALAADYARRFGVNVDAERIILTPGASGAIQLALAALVDVGEGVLLADPGYPCNRHFVELVNGQPQALATSSQGGFKVSAEQLKLSWQANTVATLLASPDNPTGQVFDLEEMRQLVEVVNANHGWLIMDEIYQGLSDESCQQTLLSITDEALVINSFSKYFGMTGWRLGWLVAPTTLVPSLTRLAQNFFLAPSTPAQYAALALFDDAVEQQLKARRDAFAERRQFCLDALAQLDLPVIGQPRGAFYLYVDVSQLTKDSFSFCEMLLEKVGVALTPGLDFGPKHQPENYLRLAYTQPVARLAEAFARIKRVI